MAKESNFKNMTVCLVAICLICSALLAVVYSVTKDPIDKAAKEKLGRAIAQVLPAFDKISEMEKAEMDGKTYSYYQAFDAQGERVGTAIISSTVGFGGVLTVMVGIDSDGVVYNTSVLSHSETPGLGAKCTGEFKEQFRGWNPEEKSLIVKKDGGDVDAITASTITSRAYTLAIASAVKVSMQLGAKEMED